MEPAQTPIPRPFNLPVTLKAQRDAQSKPPQLPTPKLRLEIQDLRSNGARDFLSVVNAGTALDDAVQNVVKLLYGEAVTYPGTRSVTLILRSMPGVAYTTGTALDDDHKEIHFSTDYIAGISPDRRKHEILGVLTHEMVHCWQWNALGTAPGGLIEGIADWIRLQCDLVPPHWAKDAKGNWDAGYQHTGYFLDYLEKAYGGGSVKTINETLRNKPYKSELFWKNLFGHPVERLWEDYGKSLNGPTESEDDTVIVEKEDATRKEDRDSFGSHVRDNT